MTQLPTSFFQCRDAVLAARARLNDNTVGTRVENGAVQVVRITYPKRQRGFADVQPLSKWLTPAEAIDYLNRMGCH